MKLPTVKVKSLAAQIRGVTYDKNDAVTSPQPGYIPVLRAGNITDDGLTFDDLVYVPQARVSEKQSIRRHDVIIAASSGSIDVVGKAAEAHEDFAGGFGAFCKVLRPNSTVHPRYFANFFKTSYYRRRVSALAAGANINNLRTEHLDDMEIPLPPLAEQKRIADILDRAEVLRASRRAALALLDTLPQAIFTEMFCDPRTNPKGWPTRRVSEIGRVSTGNTPPRADPTNYGTAIEWIKSDNIKGPHYYITPAVEYLSERGRTKARTVPAEAILITCIAGSPDCIGNAAMTDREVAFNQQINAIVVEDGNPHFFFGQLRTCKKLVQQQSTEGMKGIVSKSKLESVRLICPPLPLQQEFARRVAAVEALRSTHRASLAALDELFASLQHRAFRGEL